MVTWLARLPREPWLLEFVGDPFQSSGPFLNVWAAPSIACTALLLSLFLAVKRWKALRLGSTKQFSLYAELAVLLLLGVALFFVMRPIHIVQLIVKDSYFNKTLAGTIGQLELVLEANFWLPWFVGAIFLGLIVANAARIRQATPRVGGPGLPQLLGIGLGLSLAGIAPLALAIRRYAHTAQVVFDSHPWIADPRAYSLSEGSNIPQAFRCFCVIVVVAAVVFTVAYWRRTRFRAETTSRRLPMLGRWLGSAVCLGLSLFLFWMTKPLSAELLQPFPTDHRFNCAGLDHQERLTMLGVGPDPLVEAPALNYSDGYYIDGTLAHNVQEFAAILKNKAELWKQVNPQRDFPGIILVIIASPMSLESLRGALSAITQSGYSEVEFPLAHVVRTTQPFFGSCQGVRYSTVKMRAFAEARSCEDHGFERLQLPTQGSAQDFVNGLIPLRTQGKMPCLVLPEK